MRHLSFLFATMLWAGAGQAHGADRAWGSELFSVVTMPHQLSDAELKTLDADAYRASTLWGGWYGAWYVDRQRDTPFYKKNAERNARFFDHHLMYYDGGEIGDFVVFLDREGKIATDGWQLPNWKGDPATLTPRWFGLEAFYSEESPYKYPHAKALELSRPTLPDGSPAQSIYDALARRGVDAAGAEMRFNSNARIEDKLAEASGLAEFSGHQDKGKDVVNRRGWITGRLTTADYANPQLRDYQAWEIGRLTREIKPDGWHIDNYGDNNLYRPFKIGFGLWSEARFRDFLASRMSREELSAQGVEDVASFDIRAYVRERRDRAAGAGIQEQYNSEKWKNDPIFKAYLVHSVLAAREFHAAKYDAVQEASREIGKEVLVTGNLIPLFAGYTLIEGNIDVAHFEWPVFRSYHPKRRPMGLPPEARSSYIARLAAAIGGKGWSIASFYVQKDLTGPEHAKLFLAQAFETLSNQCVMDFGHQFLDQYCPGTAETAGLYNDFIAENRTLLSERDHVRDVVVVFDQWADVAATTASELDLDEFSNEYAGWCDFLTRKHLSWDVITSGSLKAENLAGVQLLILPSAMTLSDGQVEQIAAFLEAGGKVVATGKSGTRHGPDRFLLPREINALAPLRERQSFHRLEGIPGAAYWKERSEGNTEALREVIANVGLRQTLVTDAPESVNVVLFKKTNNEALILDLANCDFSVPDDAFHPTPDFTVTIRLPQRLQNTPLKIVSYQPGKPPLIMDKHLSDGSGSITIPIAAFEMFQTILIQAAEQDKPQAQANENTSP